MAAENAGWTELHFCLLNALKFCCVFPLREAVGVTPDVKVPSAVLRRDLSIGLTFGPHEPNPEYPALVSGPRSGPVLGEGGVIYTNYGFIIYTQVRMTKLYIHKSG